VRLSRFLLLLVLVPLALAPGCGRGGHPAQTGKLAPDFTLSDGTTTVHLASYRGQVVLLNFWGTWCPPCLAELPSLVQLHREIPSLAIVGVAVPEDEGVDEDPTAYKTFLARHQIDFTTVRDTKESAPRLFHTDMWPETYVIDRQGIIRRKFVGPQEWTKPEIQNYLKSL
jgi:cytochrome c biogenesis protein CcmG, thiol:disulfide interchange protein DsbE